MSDESFGRIIGSVFKNSQQTIEKEVQDRFVTRHELLLLPFFIVEKHYNIRLTAVMTDHGY